MRRLRPLDRLLLFTLTPLWVSLLAFDLYSAHIGTAGRVPVAGYQYRADSQIEHYPVVTRASSNGTILEGDLIISSRGQDLRGATRISHLAHRGDSEQLQIPLVVERAGERIEVAIPLESRRFWWRWKPALFLTALFGMVLLLRAPLWHSSRSVFVAASLAPFCFSFVYGAGWITYANYLVTVVAIPVVAVVWLSIAFDLAEKPVTTSSLERWAKWLVGGGLALLGAFNLIRGFLPGVPDVELARFFAFASLFALGVGAGLFGATRSYRRADSALKRQIRWIVLSGYIGFVPYTLMLLHFALLELLGVEQVPELLQYLVEFGPPLALMAIPICGAIAVFGYRFIDVDPLISAAASLSILGAGILVGILTLIPRLAEATATASGFDVSSAQLGLSIAFATVAIPIHRTLRPRIDRWFFPERTSLANGIQQLLGDLRGALPVSELTALVGQRLDALLRPESCVVYAATGSVYEPVFARGSAVPPSFAQSALTSTLEERSHPLVSDRFAAKGAGKNLSEFDQAALDTLGVAAIVPIHRRGRLAAFVCLGAKRSGDIFTATDEALLGAVANALSTQLDRLEDQQAFREARAMQEELRRYVPGAISRELGGGQDLEPRERSVTVLFVDIRGYSSYAEKRNAHEIFNTISRYMKTVSSIVEKFGGSVVEFNGDGMMAVFGAPRAHSDREKAAVQAAKAMISDIAATKASGEHISVGVGIASGAAFVGAIQAADRLIWTALGNTTNLAARLEGLTRELGAAIVIDLATKRGAGGATDGFELKEQVNIRGREKREDLYLLPLPETDQ